MVVCRHYLFLDIGQEFERFVHDFLHLKLEGIRESLVVGAAVLHNQSPRQTTVAERFVCKSLNRLFLIDSDSL